MNTQEIKQEIDKTKEEFNKRLEELRGQLSSEEFNKRRKPDDGEVYYYVDSFGDIDVAPWSDTQKDNYRYSLGNCFKTFDEAQKHHNNLETKAELRALAEELNGDEVIDWKDDKQIKYRIYRTPVCNIIFRGGDTIYQVQGTIYCLDPEFLDKAIERIGTDRLIELIKSGV